MEEPTIDPDDARAVEAFANSTVAGQPGFFLLLQPTDEATEARHALAEAFIKACAAPSKRARAALLVLLVQLRHSPARHALALGLAPVLGRRVAATWAACAARRRRAHTCIHATNGPPASALRGLSPP